MKLSFRARIFVYFFFLFAVFSAGVVTYQYNRDTENKKQILQTRLEEYADIISKKGLADVKDILQLLPQSLRLTWIDLNGKVCYDNTVSNLSSMPNHKYRPEIEEAQLNNEGTAIRFSDTNHIDYFYFAKKYNDYYVRVALPYNSDIRDILKADSRFFLFVAALFLISLGFVIYLSNLFGSGISGLRNFIMSIEKDRHVPDSFDFPNNELGELSDLILKYYQRLQTSEAELQNERNKLIQHFEHANQGIAIFSSDKKLIYANKHFIHYLGILSDLTLDQAAYFLEEEKLKPLNELINKQIDAGVNLFEQVIIETDGRYFQVDLVRIKESFEILISDITKKESNRLIKQEMTNNIAHELRTPVASIRGYIETLINNSKGLSAEKQEMFLQRCFEQVIRLSDLIRDIALISKMDQASHLFNTEQINVKSQLMEAIVDLQDQLTKSEDEIQNLLPDNIIIKGNSTLLYSVFRNLIENAIRYAGKGITIRIELYAEDKEAYYFSLADNGSGVSHEHLNRIFERFYRVAQGRNRNDGGTGLGLSIVKNAILFHGGEIYAKQAAERGLEFVFSLKKDISN
ncbi:ATP-binding protein [Porphyromonadaceae bacterium]